MKIKKTFKRFNLESINEGQFSWMTYDTDVQIGSEKQNTIDVYMFDNEGNQWHEKKYDGYGVFGNMDYYELLAKMNGYTEEDLEDKAVLKAIRAMGKAEMRDIGITLAFEPKKLKTKAKGNKVLFPALVENPKFPWKRHDFTEEAESDPNQSWYQEPDYDDDYEDDDDYEQGWYESNNLFPTFDDYTNINENKFSGIADLVKSLHFEIDPKTAEEKKIEIGYRQGEVTKRKQIEGGEYSLRRFRKEIKYDTTGKDLGVFRPGSYMAATSTLGDGPHKKAVKAVKWNQRKYDQWIEDVASNDGWKNAYDMSQNAQFEPGLIDWVEKNFRGEDAMQRIQWDIEAFAESVKSVKESTLSEGMSKSAIKKAIKVIDQQIEDEEGGDGEPLDNETLQALEQERERLSAMLESVVTESVMSRLDLIRQESDSLEDFISTVYKTPGFKHFKGDKSFKGFLELTYDYTDQEAELVEKVNESATDLLADEIDDAKVYDAFSDGQSVDARSTAKTWDDGVPVLKYIARASKKRIKLPKEFKVVDDTKYGWWYFYSAGKWHGIQQKDYGTPPFEY